MGTCEPKRGHSPKCRIPFGEYGTPCWRPCGVVRLCASPLAHSLCDPSRPNIHWWWLREPLLMDTRGVARAVRREGWRRPSPWAATLRAAPLLCCFRGPLGPPLLREQGWGPSGPIFITGFKSPPHHPGAVKAITPYVQIKS